MAPSPWGCHMTMETLRECQKHAHDNDRRGLVARELSPAVVGVVYVVAILVVIGFLSVGCAAAIKYEKKRKNKKSATEKRVEKREREVDDEENRDSDMENMPIGDSMTGHY